LIEKDSNNYVGTMLNSRSHEAILPPSIDKKQIDNLPESPGVYYFYNQFDKLIYIGKSKNLKKRVLSHFTSSGSTRRKQLFQRLVSRLDIKETANEYMASLREDAEIKKYWPKLNVAQKQGAQTFAVLHYVNRLNERRFGIKKTKWSPDALAWFASFSAARNWLGDEFANYGIHPKRGGFYAPDDMEWQPDEEGVESFLQNLAPENNASYLLLSNNQEKTHSFAAVLDGKYRGYGEISIAETITRESIEKALIQAPDSVTVQSVLQHMKMDKEVERYELD
jgi:DNA polymerase-3 subunit epsilon